MAFISTITRDDIITEALELLGVIPEGEPPSSEQLTSSSRTLNNLVKAWQKEGINLWAVDTVFLFLEKDKKEYVLGPGGDNATKEFTETDVAENAIEAANDVEVNNPLPVVGDNIGLVLDNGEAHWTVVDAVSGNTVTLTDSLPSDISSGSAVFFYEDEIPFRPVRIVDGIVRDSDGTDIPLNIWSREEYWRLSDKGTSGRTLNVWMDKRVDHGLLYVWPTTDDVENKLVLQLQRGLEITDAGNDTMDFPSEFFLALSYNLALTLAPKYGLRGQSLTPISQQAFLYKEDAFGYNREDTSVFLQPDRD